MNSSEALKLELLLEGATAITEVFDIETVAKELNELVESLFSK